jgi:outer membrane lipoprotein-sorting protein
LRAATALAAGLGLAAASLAPAAAQNLLDSLFGREAPAPAKPQPAPPAPPKRPAAPAAPPPAAQAPARPTPPVEAARPLPAPTGTQTVLAAPLTERQIIERANAYFNSIGSLIGDFTQVGGDGRQLNGRLYVQRPGKIRFEYDPPATIEVVADGSSVAVRDKKLATQDLYGIGQTPLKFLLRDRIDLARDLKIMEAVPENEGVRISVEDRSTLGGTSKITLYFDKDVANLNRWRIIDPQGFQTTVTLANLERNKRVDQALFAIDYTRILSEGNK